MPKRTPKYSLHKASGQAKVRINGRDFYLGEYDSPDSHQRYSELVARWLAGSFDVDRFTLTIDQLALRYVDHAQSYYQKNGSPTGELSSIRCALRILIDCYGASRVRDFGPMKLKAVRDRMIKEGWIRTSINNQVGRLKRVFKWGTENELVPTSVFAALHAVAGLRFGRSAATEGKPVKPVPSHDIEAVKPFVSRQVWAMIQMQLLTAMRPNEVRLMRTGDVDRSGDVWLFRPRSHKTEHHGRDRAIFIGPKAQLVLQEFLKADPDAFVFSPKDSRDEFNAERSANRTTPMTPSHRARTRKSKPVRKPGECYLAASFGRAIAKACKKAGVAHWNPSQLRHNAATEIRREYGIESVRTVLGHASGFTSEIYAELDLDKARDIIRRVG